MKLTGLVCQKENENEVVMDIGMNWNSRNKRVSEVNLRMRSGSVQEYKSRGRGFQSYSGHFHSHKLSRECQKKDLSS